MKNFNSLSKVITNSALLKRLSLTLVATIFLLAGYAQTTITATGGPWNQGSSWSGGSVPTQGNNDQVVIPAGVTITVPAAYSPTAVNVTVSGTLDMSGASGNTLAIGNPGTNTGSLTINGGGSFTIGSNTLEFKATQGLTGITNNGTFNSTGSTVLLNSNSGAVFTIAGNVTLNNVQTGASGDGNYHIQANNTLTITGTLKATGSNSWGFSITGNAPIWAVGSTFYWDRANQGLNNANINAGGPFGLAWSATSGTAGVTPGYPYNVTLVNMGSSEGGLGGVGWVPTGAVGLAGTLQAGDPSVNGRISLENVTSFNAGGIIVNNNSYMVGPPAAAPFNIQGNFTLTGGTIGNFISDGATANFNGSGTIGSPQIISTSSGSVPFGNITISNGTYVKLNSPATVSGTLTLTSGYIGTSSTNTLTVNNTSTTAVTGGSATAYVDGPLSWSIPATTSNTYIFPIGDKTHNGGAYLPLTLNPNTTSGATVTATAFNQGSGGSGDATVTSISTSEYWEVQTSSPFSSGPLVSVTRPASEPVTSDGTNALAVSNTSAGGTYTAIGGTAAGSSVTGGGVGTTSPAFIAMVKAPLSVVKLSGTDVICNGSTGSLTVGGSGGTAPYTFSLTKVGGYQASGTFTPLNPGAHEIYVKDGAGGLDSASLIVQGSLQINGNDQPITICVGGNAVLTAQNLLNSSPTYSWTSSPAGAYPSTASITVSPAVTTEYYVSSLLYNNNLLTNGDFESGNTGFTSTYSYDPNAAYTTTPGTGGYYTVTGVSSTLCQYFTTNNVIGGPTLAPESGGQYFVGDGPQSATNVAWSSGNITGLTVGTTYQFKYYYASADPYGNSNSPTNWAVLHATATGGTLTGSDVTASNVTSWALASYTFVASSTTATISLADITNIGTTNGNDFLIDNIQFLAPCPVTDSIKVFVNTAPVITRTSAAGTDAQSICVGSALANITYSITGGAPTATVSGLPAGVTYAYVYNNVTQVGTLTISGTPTAAGGPTTYTITPSGGCAGSTKTGTITVNPLPTITLGANPTVCFSAAGQTANLPYTAITGTPTTYNITGWSGGGFATVTNGALPGSPIGIAVPAGVAAGTYTATLTVANAGSCTSINYSISVTITAAPTITGTLSACIGNTTQLTGSGTAAAVNPWVSATPAVATVSNTGLVTGVSAGTSVITYTNNGGCSITATVTINALPTITGTLTVCIGATTTLTGSATAAAVNPWVSATPAVATVTNGGVVTGVAAGTSVITYTNTNGCTKTATVTVSANPTITGTLNACIGNTTQLTGSGTAAAVNPWVSATPAVATVSNTGLVTGVSAGTSVITYTNNGGCSITATVTINALPTITGTLTVCVGATTTLTGSATAAAVNPWVSATPAVATVTNGGVVTGVAAGTSVITYTNTNGCTKTATVTVSANPTITGTLNACVGNTTQLTGSGTAAAVNPWVSATPAVATVSNTGLVTGVSAGTSVITYTNNGGCTITATVTINALPTITGTLSACIGGTTTLTGSATAAAVNPWVSATPAVATITNGGVVTGVAAGTSVITYTNSNGCTKTATVTINPSPTITGGLNVCVGLTTTLTGSPTAAAVNPWVSATTAVATITNGGVVTGVAAGTSVITYTNTNGCTTTSTVTVNALPTITGAASVAVGATTPWTGSATAAAVNPWVSATPGVATVSNTGVVTGVANGTSVITYTNSNGCTITKTITVNNLPSISGPAAMCLGASVTLVGSGTAAAVNPWVSATPAVATISNTGVVTSVSTGTTVITYTDNNGNTATQTETVNPLPVITGTLSACIGNTTPLTGNGVPAAVNPWVSATPAVATISNTGVVTGVTAGTSVITYTNNNGCTKTATVTINALPTITGTLSACIGGNTTLTGSATAAAVNPWVSATPAVATITNGGVVTGVTAGTSVITYTNTNGCTITATVTINPSPTISGTLNVCVGNTTTLTGSPTAAAVNPWVSATTAVATITNGGVVSGVAAGTSVITYTNTNGCTTTSTVTVNALPTITGAASVAVAGTTTWTGSGTPAAVNPWVSATPGVATVSNTGVVTGVANGTSVITYTNNNGCTITKTITVNNLPSISGPASTCLGTPITLTGSGTPAAVGPWVSSNTAVATISNTGVITTVTAGTTTITYKDNNGNTATQVETVNPLPTIGGVLSACIGNTTALTGSATPAAVNPWVSATPAVATISNTGVVTGVTAGTSVITYTNTNGCTITATVTINALPTISGTLTVCAGSTTPLTGSPTAAAVNPWVSATPAIATISNTGVVTGVAAGTSVITYTNTNGCTVTATVTVNALPTIGGVLNVCVGNTTALTGSPTAAAVNPWVSANPGVATISNTGVVTGVAGGTSVITYTNTNGCVITATVTVNAPPTITGAASVAIGATATWTGSGTAAAVNPWVSATPGVATVSNTGVVTGVSNGTSVITYTNNNGCTATKTITVNNLPSISGPTATCLGTPITLVGSGTPDATTPWASSNTAVATISNTGVITTVTVGTTTITYKDNNGNTATQVETVNALPTISGTLSACIGNTTALTGSGTPDPATPWVSSNTAVATIDNAGVVTGVTAGTSTITYTNNNGCTITATVTINALPTISGTLTVCAGSTTPLTGSPTAAAVNPWVSATPAVATISNTGVVTGVAAGTSVITYTNSNGCTITATVTVNALPVISGVLSACVGNTTALTGSATAAAVTPWVSSNTGVATISNTGVVTGVAAGTSTITYTNNNGCVITATVTINALPTITGAASVAVGGSATWTGSGTPDPTTPWVSATPGVATVSNTGVVTGVSNGTSVITYTNSNGCTITKTITVNNLPTISGPTATCLGTSITLIGSGTPAAVAPWVSSNTAVATISNTGVITTVTAGTTTITYTDNNGNTATQVETVNALPTITGTLSACIGNTTPLTGSGTPDPATPWVSSNTAVATISNTGVVTGVTAGTSTITYTNNNGCTITATVTINALPTIGGTLTVCVNSTTTLIGSAAPAAVNPWISANTAVATISNTGVVTGVSNGTSVITYTNNNGCTITATVTVNPVPVLTITDPAGVCAPGTVDITAPAVTAGSTIPLTTTLSYYTDAAATIVLTTPTAVNTSGTYYIKALTGSGCSDVKQVVVTINPTPALTIHNPAQVCSPATVDITAPAVTAGSTIPLTTTLSYYTNAGATTVLATPTAVATGGTYYIKAQTGSGCSDVKPVVVTINPTPSLTITNPSAVCSPTVIDLTAPAVTNGSSLQGAPLSYYSDAATTAAVNNPTTVNTGGTYYIKALTAAGCSDVKPVVVTINPTPLPPTTTSDAECADQPRPQTLTASGNASTGTLVWYSSQTGGNIEPTPTLQNIGTRIYYAEADLGACVSSRTPDTLTLVAPPTVSVDASEVSIDAGTAAILIGHVRAAANDGETHSWIDNYYIDDVDTLYPTVFPPIDTTYILTGYSTHYANCSASASVHVTVLQPIVVPNIFSPNGDGVHDTWYIKNLEKYPNADVEIFNRYGQFLFQAQGNYLEEPWDGTYKGQLLPIGEYYYIIKLNSGTPAGAKPIAGGVSLVR